MALQIWLPLNGNLKNQGLSNVTVTNYGTTVDNNGKIGKCYSFNGSNQYFQFDNLNIDSKRYISLTFWCYSNNGNLRGAFTTRQNGSNHNFSLTATGLGFRDTNHSSFTTFSFEQPSVSVWTHYAIIYNDGTWIIYKNGIKICEQVYSSATLNAALNEIRVGRYESSSNNTYFNGKLNDFRIYDHCLSPKEVKELSKGLVLHYPLNNTQVLNNCFANPTFNTSSKSGGWEHWGPNGYSATYSLNTDKQFIYNKTQTYSHKVSNTGSTYYICYQSPAFDGGYRSAQAIIKMSDGSDPTGKISFDRNANVGTRPLHIFYHLGDGFYLMKCEGFRQDGSDDLVGILVRAGYTVYISEAYLENNRTVCSDLFQGNIVYDESGYVNNGTITGTLTTSTDTPRYDKCTYISEGVSNYIVSPTINIPGDAITTNIWIKSSNTSATGTYHMPFESKSPGYMEMSISSGVALRGGLYINGTRYVQNVSGNVLDGKWHMITMTYDGATIKRYVDGVLGNSTSVSGTLDATAQKYYFGKYGTNDSYASKEMYISDARLYSTALSADDIKELYNTAAFIDHKGNIGCYLFYEDADSQITKTGQVLSEEFEEISDLSDGVAKVYEEKIECNQLIEI